MTSDLIAVVHHSTLGLPAEEAYEIWREAVARTYRTRRASPISRLPRGGLTHVFLDGLIVNRSVIGAQHAVRDRRLVDNTPDHLMLQLCISGGYRGEIEGRPAAFRPGRVILANRRRTSSLSFVDSDTFGIIVPRELLHGLDVDGLATALDPARERIAAARLRSLRTLLPQARAADVSAISQDLLVFLRRLLDPSTAPDVLDAAELDAGVTEAARRLIAAELGSPTLSPETIAARVGVSRATLYRAFEPGGGVMRCVWDMRLDAIRTALEDPHLNKPLARHAEQVGFSSQSHLSREFKRRFGLPPSRWGRAHESR